MEKKDIVEFVCPVTGIGLQVDESLFVTIIESSEKNQAFIEVNNVE